MASKLILALVSVTALLVSGSVTVAETEERTSPALLEGDRPQESEGISGVLSETLFAIMLLVLYLVVARPRNHAKKVPKIDAPPQVLVSDSPKALRHKQQLRESVEVSRLVDAVRSGRARELPCLLDLAFQRNSRAGVEALLAPCLRACVSHRCFQEALVAYEHVAKRIEDGTCSIWSLLLYCAVEAGKFERCEHFCKQLLESSTLSAADFVNIVRYYAAKKDVKDFVTMLDVLERSGLKVNCCTRNRALGMALSEKSWPLASLLLKEHSVFVDQVDTVGFNTVLKGLSTMGEHGEVFQLYEQMLSCNVKPSDVTYGVLMQACVISGDSARCKSVFADLKSVMAPNMVHYTTYMKSLILGGDLKEASLILDEMLQSNCAKPDVVTYSTIVKAHADIGDVAQALHILERMTQEGLAADSIILHILLNGCCVKPMNAVEVNTVFKKCLELGLEPCNTTLSILTKALTASRSWTEALELASSAPSRFGVHPEPRIYAQLAQACFREGERSFATKVYATMMQQAACLKLPVPTSANDRMFRICTAASWRSPLAWKLHRACNEAGGLLTPEQVEAVLA